MNIALLPAKPLPLAKTRLASALTSNDRAAVTRAMFDDVLGALLGARSVDAVLLVTADHELAERGRAAGAHVCDEGAPRGLNGAVALGTECALSLGASSVAVVLSDVPLITSVDLDTMIARVPARGALVVPSKEGIGTNALLRSPSDVFPSCFGGRSLERHVAAAERLGLACTLWRNARVGFDVDTPEDLAALAATESPTATYRETVRLGLAPSSVPWAGRST